LCIRYGKCIAALLKRRKSNVKIGLNKRRTAPVLKAPGRSVQAKAPDATPSVGKDMEFESAFVKSFVKAALQTP
jgi:hypothetical protein